MFRAGQNLKHLHHARESIKGKVYAGVLGVDGATAVLEPSRTGTYVKYPYLGSHGSSTQIPVTQHRSHVFLRGVI